jgi:hypothetical protein
MAHSYINNAILLFVFWVVLIQIKHLARWRALKKFGDENDCGDIPTVPNRLPGGLDRVVKVLTNGKAKSNVLIPRLFLPP